MPRHITETIKFAHVEGGVWSKIEAHSLEMPDGSRWDAVNGWTTLPVGLFHATGKFF